MMAENGPSLSPTSDPLVLAEAFAGPRAEAIRIPPASVAPIVAPSPVATDSLPDASGIRPEYRNSGRWIAQPKG